ncbi:MAG TPA: HPF/RaiA family ribosome-associated protein [Phycisphaerae bacterium]|nr:HPF/RaiA family ribosome-associated protein [Phycisphaerae bacterium]HNU46392.1 HPF/RaiA family ribosome-associated protein [Phycisphaerae bacterium]
MDLRITIKNLPERAELRELAEQRVTTALQRFEDRIHKVTLLMEDVTGHSKQAVDKRCRISVRLHPGGEVMIDELNEDIGAALAFALDRLKVALTRKAARYKRGVGGG